jgi:hypothetical protein
MVRCAPVSAVCLLGTVACCGLLEACAFPYIEFEERSAARELSYREPRRAEPESRASALPVPPLAAKPSRARRSVIAPLDPTPEISEIDVPPNEVACHRALKAAGVQFTALPAAAAPGVRWPIRLRGPIRGVTFEGMDRDPVFGILDCRLGVSLVGWARDLRRAGVRRVDYYSMYRPGARIGGDGAVSSHAHGLAIDAARFTLDNGAVLDVQDDWEGRTRGQAPCPVRREESRGSRLLRGVTCSGIDHNLFQIALTPHYNKAHANHLHLERRLDVDWIFVR